MKIARINKKEFVKDFFKYTLLGFIGAAALVCIGKLCGVSVAFADTSDAATTAIQAIITVAKVICIVVGAIFILMGIIKYAIASSSEDGPAQQKAATMLASGVVLVLLGSVIIDILHLDELVSEASNIK